MREILFIIFDWLTDAFLAISNGALAIANRFTDEDITEIAELDTRRCGTCRYWVPTSGVCQLLTQGIDGIHIEDGGELKLAISTDSDRPIHVGICYFVPPNFGCALWLDKMTAPTHPEMESSDA